MTRITIAPERCTRCGRCQRVCPFKLFNVDAQAATQPAEDAERRCIACGHCMAACPTGAIRLNEVRPNTLESANGPATGFDEVRRLVLRRRSVRLFQQRMVPRNEVERVIDACRWSPTAMNRQQVVWTVVLEPERAKEIAGQVVEFMRLKHGQSEIVTAWDHGYDVVMRGAPHLVAVHGALNDPWAKTDCVIAMTTFDLLARSAGLGTCWAGFFLRAAAEHRPIAEALGLPEDRRFHGALLLGYSLAAFLRVPPRNPARVDWIE
jgi:nitroreductase/NAD-dependent dihydropyrimidine dehydrogenase PreA subunit